VARNDFRYFFLLDVFFFKILYGRGRQFDPLDKKSRGTTAIRGQPTGILCAEPPVIPGIRDTHNNGRPHQISRANATAASATAELTSIAQQKSLFRIAISYPQQSQQCAHTRILQWRQRNSAAVPESAPASARSWCRTCTPRQKNNHPRRVAAPFPVRVFTHQRNHDLSSASAIPRCFFFSDRFREAVMTLPRNFNHALSGAPVGMRIIFLEQSGHRRQKLQHALQTFACVGVSLRIGLNLADAFPPVHSKSDRSRDVLRSSETIRKISHTSLIDSKWSRAGPPSTCTTTHDPPALQFRAGWCSHSSAPNGQRFGNLICGEADAARERAGACHLSEPSG